MTDAYYENNLEFHENTAVHAKFLMHSLERTAGGIALYVNAAKRLIIFKQSIAKPL